MSEEVNDFKMDHQINDDISTEVAETPVEKQVTQEEEASEDQDPKDTESQEIDGNEDDDKVASEPIEDLLEDTAEDETEAIQNDPIKKTPEETQEVENKKQEVEHQPESVIEQDGKPKSEILDEDNTIESNFEESQNHQSAESEGDKTEAQYMTDTESQLDDEDVDIQEPQVQDKEEAEFMLKTGTNPYEDEKEENEANNNQLDFTKGEIKVSDKDSKDPVEQPSAPQLALNNNLISTNTDSPPPLAIGIKKSPQVKSQKPHPNKIGQNSHVSNSNKEQNLKDRKNFKTLASFTISGFTRWCPSI
ncbi:unnamed protein product [[Candida] boidinii]|nr:unnamed protein product [[Candida] boidinii]